MVKLTDRKGIALPIVLVLIAIMLLLGITILSLTSFDSKTVSNLSGSEKALHIAEAGYNKYLWFLNQDTYFYQYGEHEEEGFKIESVYDGLEYPQWAGYTKAYEKTAYVSGNQLVGYFKIEVTPPTVDNPVLGVQSTGWTADGSGQRTIYVEIHQRVFTNYVIFEGGEGEGVYLPSDSIIKGPYFTNEDLLAYPGAQFYDFVGYAKNKDVTGVDFEKEPVKMNRLQRPVTNEAVTQWGDPDNGGYTYSGRTYILLDNEKLKIKQSDGTLLENVAFPESGVVYIKSMHQNRGDLYLSGILDGRLTLVADGDIYLCAYDPTKNWADAQEENYGGITYADQDIPTYENKNLTEVSNDMLGLVTDNDIIIHNRTNNWPIANQGDILTAVEDIRIQAALYCNSVVTQDIDYLYANELDLGQIHYIGSRTVKKSSITGVSIISNGAHYGYSPDNQFDYRMSFDAPPHFIEPMNSGWKVKSWKELPNPTPTP